VYLCGIFCNVTRWIYHIDLDYAVVVNYNALIWSIKAIVPLSQGLYNTSALTGLQLNPTSTYPSDYFLGRSLNASKPGDILHADTRVLEFVYTETAPSNFLVSSAGGEPLLVWTATIHSLGVFYGWNLKSSTLFNITSSFHTGEIFGQASAATTGTAPHQYALLCSGIPSLNSFYLRRYDINNKVNDAVQEVSEQELPELGAEAGGPLNYDGDAVFGNRDAKGNRLTLYHYADSL